MCLAAAAAAAGAGAGAAAAGGAGAGFELLYWWKLEKITCEEKLNATKWKW